MFRFWPHSGCGGKNYPLLWFFVNNSKPTFHFLKLSFTYFLAISQNLRAWRQGMTEISCWCQLLRIPIFQHLNGSNFWTTFPIWMNNPHWKATLLLFSNIVRLTTFHMIYLLTSAVLHWFQERCVMCHHSATFKPIWCFGIPIGHQMIISM